MKEPIKLRKKDFVDTYCQPLFQKSTPEAYFCQKPIAYTCEAHRLKLANDDKKAKEEFEVKKETMARMVRHPTS